MADYVAPGQQNLPFQNLPSQATPVKAEWLNGVEAALTDLAGASAGRVKALEQNPTISAGAFRQIMQSLGGGESAWLTVLGDSTGNETTEWPYLLAQWLGSQYPSCRVQHALWNDTNQRYDPWTVVQAAAGERYVAFTNPGRTAFLRPDAFTMPTGDIDIRVKLAMDDWTPAAQTAIAARYGGAGSRGFFFAIGATGTIDFNWTTDGTTNIQKVSSATGFTDGTAGWVRVTLDVDNGAGGYTWTAYTSTDGDTWTQVGISNVTTGGATSIFVPTTTNWEIGGRGGNGSMLAGKVYEVQIRDGIDGKTVNPQPVDAWLFNPTSGSNIIPSFGGSPTLYILNGSRSGADLTYLADSTRMPLMTRSAPGQLVFLSTSHNDADKVGASLTSAWDSWLTALKARLPGAAFCLLTQNPEISPRTLDLTKPHAQRRRELMTWAARSGVYCIDTYGAFQADPRGVAALLNVDGIHPTNAAGSNAGSQLWADTVKRAFT
jgi:hypothetical protein